MNQSILLLIILYLMLMIINTGYIVYYPTIPIYGNNDESSIVENRLSNITESQKEFFYLTNESVVYAFLPYVKENYEDLQKISKKQDMIILFFKYFINRARPWQVDQSIVPLSIETAQTPAYPAGHAYQAYMLEKYLSKKYPEQEGIFKKIAKRCDSCRVDAGLHYPSDGEFSAYLVNLFN